VVPIGFFQQLAPGDGLGEPALARDRVDQGRLQRAQPHPVGELLGLLERGDLERRGAGQHLAGHPHPVGHVVGGAVVHRDQAPQLAVLEDRGRARGRDPHVGQVLEVDRRDAAQHRAAQVERGVGERVERGQDAGRNVARVGDQPQRVAAVQLAGLARDVRGRVVQAQEGRQLRGAPLGHDLAVPVPVEAVDHGPVEAADAGRLGRQHVARLAHRGGRLEPRDRGPDQREEAVQRAGRGRLGRLQLDHQQLAAAVHDRVELARLAVQLQPNPDRAHVLAVGQAQHRRGGRAAEHLVEPLPEQPAGVAPEQLASVLRNLHDPLGVRLEGQQQPVGLDRAGHVDRLAVAVGEIDGRCRDGSAVDHETN
jgi:hypothetical protein